ncbi:uncharacterized protein FYW49_010657 [Xenentodon cancila]
MSNRDSLGFGDLLPQDVVEVFAQEKHSKRGLKKRSRSLRRAFGWLKGKKKKKKKNLCSNGQSPGLGPALDLALDGHSAGHQGGHKGGQKSGRQAPQGNNHAIPKRDENDKTPAPQLFPENVFIESSRPKYLEDLHTEALEGLKMMQQEETGNGVEYLDNGSTISTMTIQTDGEGGGFVTDSTIPDTSSVVSVRSSVSTRSSRSGLTRQGSTFRPLNSGKKSEKAKRRRRQRTTVVGIPQHVQKELGLDRTGWILTQPLDEEQLYNDETDNSPTTDGPQNAAESSKEPSTSFKRSKTIQPLTKDKVKQLSAPYAGHRDDLALLDHLGPDLAGEQRPRSLAVPWMTTASSLQQQPPSPVMTMSPQAAYMSKIIPNAVLPPSIDVVEISRSRSRNSVRTVSKSSLLLSSPAPSRASSRASSVRTTSSNITSVSQYNYPNLSDTSCWSNSDSSETLVSDSSTISSCSTPRQKSQDRDASAKEDKSSVISSNSRLRIKGDEKKNDQFLRSLSVKKSKRAPPPPRRSNSLHNKLKLRPRDLADMRGISRETSLNSTSVPGEASEKDKLESSQLPSKAVDSPGYHGDTSSLEDSTGSGSFSFHNSQLQKPKTKDAKKDMETVSPEASPVKEPLHEKKLNKIISPSSGYSSQDPTSPQVSEQPHSYSSKNKKGILAKLQRLFPGSAPSSQTKPVGPEIKKSDEKPKLDFTDTVSVSPSVRTLRDLFNIPPPPKVHAPPPPPPEVWAHNKRTVELLLGPPAPGNTYAIIKKNPKDRRQQRPSPSVSLEGSVKSSVVERKHKNPTVAVDTVNRSLHVLEAKRFQENGVLNGETHKENKERLAENGGLKENSKDEKVRVCDMLNGMLMRAVEKREERLAAVEGGGGQNVSTQSTDAKTNMDTLPPTSLVHISPSPTSTPAQQLQPPTLRTTKPASITSVQVVSPESPWPPPPPPLVPVGIGGHDEIDKPLPPPPFFGEEGLVLPVQVPRKDPGFGGNLSLKTEFVKPQTKVPSVSAGVEAQRLCSSQEVAPPPLAIPPPPPYTAPPPPTTAIQASTTEIVEVSPLPLPVESEESTIPVVQDTIPMISLTSASPAKEAPPPLVVKDSPPPPKEVPALPNVEFTPTHSGKDAVQLAENAPPESELTAPQSSPPPPPLPSKQMIDSQQENIPLKPETNTDGITSILLPPVSIPPPPPVEPLRQPSVEFQTTNNPAIDEAPPLPPSEFRNSPSSKQAEEPAPPPTVSIALPSTLPEDGPINIQDQSSPQTAKSQRQEETSAPVVDEEPTTNSTPSPLNMVNSSPEPPEAQEQPVPEVTVDQQQPSSQIPTSSASSEAPQKPIRRSLIIISPPSASPPVDASQTVPKSPSPLLPPVPSSAGAYPVKKSPPATAPAPSMNLQEAIRLRTAARSRESPSSRFSLHSPLSPPSISPTSTASFIFSKSNKKVVIETKQVPEDTQDIKQKKLEVSSATKAISEAEGTKKGPRVPPPVAKKPKAMGKGVESCEGVDQTAGQEAQQESVQDGVE